MFRTLGGVLLAVLLVGCGGGSSSSSSSSGSNTATHAEADVGPAGATVAVEGASLVIPPNALTATTHIVLDKTDQGSPEGFQLYSPMFRCQPDGLTFAQAATMTLDFTGNANVMMYWSRDANGAFTQLPTQRLPNKVSGPVLHFSRGFAGVCVCNVDTACTTTCACDPDCG